LSAGELDKSDKPEITDAIDVLVRRAWNVSETAAIKSLAERELEGAGGRVGEGSERARPRAGLLKSVGHRRRRWSGWSSSPGIHAWDNWTVPMSMREVEPGVRLIMNTGHLSDDHGGSRVLRRRTRTDHDNQSKTPSGKSGPSQLLWTYGPGALIDLPSLSVVTLADRPVGEGTLPAHCRAAPAHRRAQGCSGRR
jgi:hypothetical protein